MSDHEARPRHAHRPVHELELQISVRPALQNPFIYRVAALETEHCFFVEVQLSHQHICALWSEGPERTCSASNIRGASGKEAWSLVVVLVVRGAVFSILVAVVACHYFYFH